MVGPVQVLPATGSESSLSGRHASSSTLSVLTNTLTLTVEWSGRYSVDKTLALLAYSTSSSHTRLRDAMWIMATPLAALASPLLLELMPLSDPFLGWRNNELFFLRTMLRGALMYFCIDSSLDLYLPERKLPLAALVLMNIIQGGLIACVMMAFAAITGVFPIPFVIAAASPLYAVVGWSVRFVFERVLLPVESDPLRIQRIQRRLPQVMRLFGFSTLLLYAYNAFATGFSQVPDSYQAAMAVLLQLIKLLLTHVHWGLSHIGSPNEAAALDTTRDLSTVHVASGARFFHALFTTTCLQKSKSSMTLVVVVFFSLLQEWGTVRGLRSRERSLARATEELVRFSKDTRTPETQHACFLDTLACIAERAQVFHGPTPSSLIQSSQRRSSQTRVASHSVFRQQAQAATSLRTGPSPETLTGVPCPQRQAQAPLTIHESGFLHSATRLLQAQEAVLLRLYVEIFVPLLFSAYLTLVQFTPNIQFLPSLRHSDSQKSLGERLFVQIVIKILALVFILRRHCQEPRGLRQLVFALSTMHVVMLRSCVLNTLCVFDFPLLHNGHDFTFQFKWLRQHAYHIT